MTKKNIPFTSIVKPVGARCNLRCEHCFYLDKVNLYEAGEGNDKIMSDSLLERFIREYIAAQPQGIQEINFVWQGGEPTLAGLDFFKKAVALEKKYAPSGIKILNSLQTNGTLLDDDWCRFLSKHNFLVGISIDGPEKLHDRFRRHANGQGSFKEAMAGLEKLRQHQVEFNILTCLQSENAEYPQEVYQFLKSLGTSFIQFIPIIEHLEKPPDPSNPLRDKGTNDFKLTSRTISGHQFGRFANQVFDCWLEGDVGRIFIQMFDVFLGLMMGHPAGVCVQSRFCGRGIVVEHNGDVFACDHYVFPEYKLGNITNRKLSQIFNQPLQYNFGIGKEKGLPRACRECRLLNLCHGGCPAHRTKITGGGEAGLNHLCEGYKMFLNRTMPVFQAMEQALRHRQPASAWKNFYTGIAGMAAR